MEEVTRLGPILKEDEPLFGVAHIYAGFNDTFVVSSGRSFDGRGAASRSRALAAAPAPCRCAPAPTGPASTVCASPGCGLDLARSTLPTCPAGKPSSA